MLYALKDNNGAIIAIAEKAIAAEWQPVRLDDEALHAFLHKNPSAGKQVMREADADFIRVLEDVIDLLIDKALIHFTELPAPAQNKLLQRRRYREQLIRHKDTVELLGQDDSLI